MNGLFFVQSRVNRQGKMPEIRLSVRALGLLWSSSPGPASSYFVCMYLKWCTAVIRIPGGKLLPDDNRGAPHICLDVRFRYTPRWSALQLPLRLPPPTKKNKKKMEQREQIQAKSKLFYSCCTTNKQTSGSIQSSPLEGLWALPKRGKWWGMGCREAGGDRGEARWRSCGC